MCGRVFILPDLDELMKLLGLDAVDLGDLHLPLQNVAPTERVPVLVRERGKNRLTAMRWGLIPAWWSQPRAPTATFNARREGVASAPTFRGSLGSQRAIVPVSGFYEWKPGPDGKTPYALRPADGGLLGLAGLWAAWRGPDSAWVRSVTVLTRPAEGAAAAVHDRMPVTLPAAAWDAWLSPDTPRAEVEALMDGPPRALTLTEVGRGVGNARDKSGGWWG